MSFDLPFDFSLTPPGERVLVAVSSGADSMALLWMLHEAKRDIVVGHVNHSLKELRGDECQHDEEFVRAHCARIGVPFCCRQVEIVHRNGHAAEAPTRDARYQALLEMARENNCPRVATAHTASDVLETVLLHWLRGATVRGFAGIPPQRELAVGVLLVRPLLAATREETQATCRAAGWAWRDDASNFDRCFGRNRVRHDVLPHLIAASEAQSAARLARQTARAAGLLRDDLDCLDQMAREHLAILLRPTRQRADRITLSLDGEEFQKLHPALQRRVLRVVVEQLQGDTRDLAAARIEEVLCYVAEIPKRRVWQWRRGIFVEWTGAMAGNRLRIWLVLKRH